MTILTGIFFFGLAISLVVLKGILMSREFAAGEDKIRLAKEQDPSENGSRR